MHKDWWFRQIFPKSYKGGFYNFKVQEILLEAYFEPRNFRRSSALSEAAYFRSITGEKYYSIEGNSLFVWIEGKKIECPYDILNFDIPKARTQTKTQQPFFVLKYESQK